jgi:gamma-glutamylputrescine oxidase
MSLLFANDRRGAYPPSWYAATATPPAPQPPLEGEARADVCVIGGGYTGLSAALHLAEAGHDVALLEAHRLGFGASGRNGGQLGSGQRMGQGWIEARMGAEDARRLWEIGEEAKATVLGLAQRHGFDIAYRPGLVGAYETAAGAEAAWREAEHLAQAYGYDRVAPLDAAALRALVASPRFVGGTLDRGAGHLHPLRLAFGLAGAAAAAGARLHERSLVTGIERGPEFTVHCETGRLRAKQVVLAVNGYHGGLERGVAARVLPINNFIVATAPLGPRAAEVLAEDVAVFDDRFVVSYWRLSEDGRLLFGGGESYGDRFPRDIARVVRKPLERIYPQLKKVEITHAWGGTLGITAARMPHFARPAPGMWSAGGYSGHGVAMAVMAGRILAEAIGGEVERFDAMARVPVPRFPGGPALRQPVLALAMSWYALRDRLGI